MANHEKMDYVEFAAADLMATKAFFETVFSWNFIDYGSEYTSFSNQGLDGGFFKADLKNSQQKGGALIVFYSNDIKATEAKIKRNGGVIVKEIFDFPGGCRFHFTEPSGNEFAVWSEGI